MTGMKRVQSREPRWWRWAGVGGMVLGAAFWVAVIVVAWHFIEKFW